MTSHDDAANELPAAVRKFILHWGELGTRWGINRTVAQIHALLYLSAEPLPADHIARVLSLARSNVSTSLRELQGWGIVRVVHRLGDRRDHFESLQDVWQMVRIIAEERKRREIDPTIAVLRDCAAELAQARPEQAHARDRVEEMQRVVESLSALFDEVRRVPPATLRHVAKLRTGLRRLFGGVA